MPEIKTMNQQPLPIFVDTDIGDDIDDALALALVLDSPELQLVGVSTVFGDTHLRARLASTLLSVFGKTDVPVAAGCSLPLRMRHRPSGVRQASVLREYPDEQPLAPLSGPDLLIERARAYPGRLILLCFGPLTNIAAALSQEPGLVTLLQHIYLMGGASRVFWPDWNVRSDVVAAQRVLAADIPITMIGWNVTWRCHLHAHDVEAFFRTTSPRPYLLARLIAAWRQQWPWWRSSLPSLHDPLVAAALCVPHLFRFERLPVQVLARGLFAGFTIPRILGGKAVWAATWVDCDAAKDWMTQRWLSR
jgi:purine nucleosidase/pyrimidine-specific ribonucleoside hydrolase